MDGPEMFRGGREGGLGDREKECKGGVGRSGGEGWTLKKMSRHPPHYICAVFSELY